MLLGSRSPRAASTPTTTVQAERFEVLNADGEVCLTLGVNSKMGSVRILNPSIETKGGGSLEVASFGAIFPGSFDARMWDATGNSKASLALTVQGEPAVPGIRGNSADGKPAFSLTGASSAAPVLKLWKALGDEPTFTK